MKTCYQCNSGIRHKSDEVELDDGAVLHQKCVGAYRAKLSSNQTIKVGGAAEAIAKNILVITSDHIPDGFIPIGMARGSTARSKNAIADFGAGLKNIVGGEVVSYTRLMADAREQAIERMQMDAHRMGATHVVSVRFSTATIEAGIAEILAYGTAIREANEEEVAR